MNHLEQRFINHESSEHEFQYRIESGPSPAARSGLREFDLVMTWSCQPAPATTPRLRLNGDHTYWSLN